jgi:hypothetical protein
MTYEDIVNILIGSKWLIIGSSNKIVSSDAKSLNCH